MVAIVPMITSHCPPPNNGPDLKYIHPTPIAQKPKTLFFSTPPPRECHDLGPYIPKASERRVLLPLLHHRSVNWRLSPTVACQQLSAVGRSFRFDGDLYPRLDTAPEEPRSSLTAPLLPSGAIEDARRPGTQSGCFGRKWIENMPDQTTRKHR